MSRSDYRGPQLPKTLLDQVGGAEKKRRGDVSRKDRRKAERQAKKHGSRPLPRKIDRSAAHRQRVERSDDDDEDESQSPPPIVRKQPVKDAKPVKSILKTAKPAKTKEPTPEPEVDLDEDDESEASDAASDDSFTVSRQAAKAGLADEDDAIAALERKLGMKGSKRGKEVNDDELDWMVTGGGSESEDEAPSLKRKRPDDAKWLKDKRMKASGVELDQESNESDSIVGIADDSDEEDDVENPFSADELSDGDDFAGFDSEDDHEQPQPARTQRENPYIAPTTKDATAGAEKYIPPSLRKPASSDEEALKQLRRQMQGQLNRLSDANLLSILQAMEDMYTKQARQHVTSTIVDLLVSLVSDPSTLNDTFIILHAGFAAALYKVVGTDFGAQLLEKLAESFDRHPTGGGTEGKQQLNIIAFLSNLYTFQVVGSAMMFDYVRALLNDLSEHNTELLLRVIRTSGQQLRQEDPSALKDIVLLLQRHISETGEANLSVRTKYMIDTIRDLKNNRMKTGVAASALATEHTTRMKKILGTLNTRSLRATEPLRVTLADIRDSEKKGKWWLVGASYHDPAKLSGTNSAGAKTSSATARRAEDLDGGYESDTPGHTNLTKAARAQGMNTDIRRQIFVNIVGADDFQDAYIRLHGLKLKTKQYQQEVPRVLIHCVGVEEVFNPFYTLLARRLCSEDSAGGKGVKKALQFGVWDVLKRLRNPAGNDSDGEERGGELGLQKIVNLAKFYGSLIADGTLSIAALKTADFALLPPGAKAYTFAEVTLTTVLTEVRRKAKDAMFATKVQGIFATASVAPQMIQGLEYFLRNVVANASLANGKKEVKAVERGCEVALETLRQAAEENVGGEMGEEDSSDMD